jgi:hypothetical protein
MAQSAMPHSPVASPSGILGSTMSKRKKETNPHCPVAGCEATKPHAEDDVVRGLIKMFAPPAEMASWVCSAIHELAESISRDLEEGRVFAWISRLRQPEELYFRALYAIFIASELELHHIISGAMPNSITPMYKKVNALILEGQGELTSVKPGLMFGTFRPIETLHGGAHTSFSSLFTCISIVHHPDMLPAEYMEKYLGHLKTYCSRLNYISGVFKAGKEKEVVLEAIKQLHRS